MDSVRERDAATKHGTATTERERERESSGVRECGRARLQERIFRPYKRTTAYTMIESTPTPFLHKGARGLHLVALQSLLQVGSAIQCCRQRCNFCCSQHCNCCCISASAIGAAEPVGAPVGGANTAAISAVFGAATRFALLPEQFPVRGIDGEQPVAVNLTSLLAYELTVFEQCLTANGGSSDT